MSFMLALIFLNQKPTKDHTLLVTLKCLNLKVSFLFYYVGFLKSLDQLSRTKSQTLGLSVSSLWSSTRSSISSFL